VAVVASAGQFAAVGAQAEGERRNDRVLARGGMK